MLFAACAVGPDYERPDGSAPPAWAYIPEVWTANQSKELESWWTYFNDPTLTQMIDQALAYNHDLRLAQARIREARAQRRSVRANLLPWVNAGGGYTRSRESGAFGQQEAADRQAEAAEATAGAITQLGNALTPGTEGDLAEPQIDAEPVELESDLFQAGFDASWEIDVFGGNRRLLEGATADLQAAVESSRDVRVVILGEVARNYVDLRGLQLQRDLTQRNLETQDQSLSLTQQRFAAGITSEIDVHRATAQVETTRALLPQLEYQITQAMNRISVLTGQTPGALEAVLRPEQAIPGPAVPLAIGMPSDLLRRRPDIRQAERQLAAATADIGVATADFYPRFYLNGEIGKRSLEAGDLLDSSSLYWSYGPSIRWPIFQGGRLRANLEGANARQEQAMLRYEQTILRALEETENAYVAYAAEQERHDALARSVHAAAQSLDLSRLLYNEGLNDFLSVLDAERVLFDAQLREAQNRAAIAANLVALYKAVGGGWNLDGADEGAIAEAGSGS